MELQATLSKVHADDFPQVVEVWEKSVRATHHFVLESDIEIFRPLVRESLPHVPDLVCVRDAANNIAGFIGVAGMAIDMLFVHPDWRGKGVGRQLIRYAIDERGAQTVEVNEQNEQAVGFYRKMGFVVEGRSPLDDFGKPYPLLHMRLDSAKPAPRLRIKAPSAEEKAYLENSIDAFNIQRTGIPYVDGEVAVLAYDDQDQLIGGANGSQWGDSFSIAFLWLEEPWRGQDIGTQIMDAIEREAAQRGCTQIVLDTFTFQAPGFYLKRGYEVVGKIDNFPTPYTHYFLKKVISKGAIEA